MALRPNENLKHALIRTFTVKAAAAATKGLLVKFGGSDTEVEDAGANETGIGIALATAAAGAQVQVAMLAGSVQITAQVGTGDATRGAFLNHATDGLKDVGTLGGGTVLKNVIAIALQSGVAGDFIAVLPTPHAAVSA